MGSVFLGNVHPSSSAHQPHSTQGSPMETFSKSDS